MRKTKLKLIYEGVDISKDISTYLLDYSYTDNDNDAEEIQVNLHNVERPWMAEWYPKKGDKMSADIEFDDETVLSCGEFEVDDISCKGKGNTASIKAVSAAISGEIKDTKRSKAWEKIDYKSIVKEIASKNKMSAIFNIKDNKKYDKLDQKNTSDIEFIKKISTDLGYDVKVESKKIIITDEDYYKSQEAEYEIKYPDLKNPTFNADGDTVDLLDYEFSETSLGAYTACENQYKDPKTGITYKARAGSEKEKNSGRILRLNKKVKSQAECEKVCKDALKKENAKSKTAKFNFAPTKPIYAKKKIKVTDFGEFSGDYLIDEVSHNVSSSGYTVSLSCRKFYEGMSIKVSSETVDSQGNTMGGAGSDSIEKMIAHAESMIGMRYSQPMRMSANYADCSSTVCRSMSAAGLMPPGAAFSTANLPSSGYLKKINMNDLQRGDVLNYRRGGKGHAMIYIGNGQVIEAQPKRGVCIGKLRTQGYTAYRPTKA